MIATRARVCGLAAVLLSAGGCLAPVPTPVPESGVSAVFTPGGTPRPIPTGVPLTRPERTGYTETSTHADVLAFLDSLQARGATMHRFTMGRTNEGRDLPIVVASRPLVRTPAEARATGKPIVFVQGNIHGGEVEGKEAVQMLLRDLLLQQGPNVLDSIVLIALPIYNADGNEVWGPQERQRGSQNGPERVGQRPNAQQLDLNRDYIKAEAPETRASLALVNAWDPHVFVDLHTTNGSYHGYALTYSPSLHPSAPLGEYTRRFVLEPVRRRTLERHGFPTFDYGNFNEGRAQLTDTVKSGWFTYDHRPRFGTNYHGLRNRISVLSEAYSHDPFDRRVAATYAFVRELLSHVAEISEPMLRVIAAQGEHGGTMATSTGGVLGVALRSQLPATGPIGTVIIEDLERTGDSTRTEAGVPPGIRRTGRFRAATMPVVTRFEATRSWDVPLGFVLPPQDTAAVRLLRTHGITVGQLERPWSGEVFFFLVDSATRAARPFQGHNEVLVHGEVWRNRRRELPAGSFVVDGRQPLGRLALVLLDPMTDDGLVTWNYFDDRLAPGQEFPVLQLRHQLPTPVRDVP